MPKSKKRKKAKSPYFTQRVEEVIKIQKPGDEPPKFVPTGRIIKIKHVRRSSLGSGATTTLGELIAKLPIKSDESNT